MNLWWNDHFPFVKVWNHPTEKTISKWMFEVPGSTYILDASYNARCSVILVSWSCCTYLHWMYICRCNNIRFPEILMKQMMVFSRNRYLQRFHIEISPRSRVAMWRTLWRLHQIACSVGRRASGSSEVSWPRCGFVRSRDPCFILVGGFQAHSHFEESKNKLSSIKKNV